MAGYDRWKRLTTAEHIGEHLWGRRQELLDTLPAPADPAVHIPLVLPEDEGFHGICAANGCRYLGPYRNAETATRGDAKRHATQRNVRRVPRCSGPLPLPGTSVGVIPAAAEVHHRPDRQRALDA